MLHNTKKIFIFLIGAFFFTLTYAETSSIPIHIPELTPPQYCPPVESLYSEGGTLWKGPDGWTSSTPSLENKLDEFIGAQWVGINVGELICLYRRHDRNNFPVSLQRHVIVNAPISEKNWSDDKGGYKNCNSNDIRECPFIVKMEAPIKDVYEEIDFFKKKVAKG